MAVRVVRHSQNIRRLLRSDAVEADLKRRADAISAAAGDGHLSESSKGRNRARATVSTDTVEAIISEAHDHTLTAALDAGRG
jgi:hypothetical protein